MEAGTSETRYKWDSRQAMYLRIGPYTVLQMILYLEPAHTFWMKDSVLERLLIALKERIPAKLRSDREASKKGSKANRDRSRVDVFRGADYQMAYFFRSTSQKHVVLLKEKLLMFDDSGIKPDQSSSSPEPLPMTRSTVNSKKRSRRHGDGEREGNSRLKTRPALRKERPARDNEVYDLTQAEEDGHTEQHFVQAEDVAIKMEENDDDNGAVIIPDSSPIERHDDPEANLSYDGRGGSVDCFSDDDDDEKKSVPTESKPKLKVHYQGYTIFSRTLVVIVEPYPPLSSNARQSMGPPFVAGEVRQLSVSVPPLEVGSQRSSSTARFSSTPGLPRRHDGGKGREGALFRMESTPAESVLGDYNDDHDNNDDDIRDEDNDDGMEGLKASTQTLANKWNSDEDEEDEDLE